MLQAALRGMVYAAAGVTGLVIAGVSVAVLAGGRGVIRFSLKSKPDFN
jgi:hypothetical protein